LYSGIKTRDEDCHIMCVLQLTQSLGKEWCRHQTERTFHVFKVCVARHATSEVINQLLNHTHWNVPKLISANRQFSFDTSVWIEHWRSKVHRTLADMFNTGYHPFGIDETYKTNKKWAITVKECKDRNTALRWLTCGLRNMTRKLQHTGFLQLAWAILR